MPVDTTGPKCPHGKAYGSVEQCGDCRKSAAISVKSASPKADLREIELLENEYRAHGKRLHRMAQEWLEEGTARERSAAIKAIDAAIKCDRLFHEVRQQRIEIEHDQWLVEQKRLLSGGGGN